MKQIILKNGERIDISEREFLGAMSSMQNKQGVFISRIQKFLGPYEIVSIDPVDNQLDFGRPFKLFNEAREEFEPGRFFVDGGTKEVIAFPMGVRKVIGKYDDLETMLFSEDDYIDKLGEKRLKQYPNDMIGKIGFEDPAIKALRSGD